MFRRPWFTKLFPVLILLCAASFLACKAVPKKSAEEIDNEKLERLLPGESVVVNEGQSSQPAYSPKGDRLLYVAWKRKTHQQPQVYEMNLLKKTQRRITYQDGSTFYPQYHPRDNWIVYSSSTDEIKENPPLLNPFLKFRKLIPEPYALQFEVYMHSLEGLEITRLSDRPGFDGEARFSLDGNSLVWTQGSGLKLQPVLFNRASAALKPLMRGVASASTWSASPNGAARAWLTWDKGLAASNVEVQKGNAPAAKPTEQLRAARRMNVTFTPDSKWILWSESDAAKGDYDLWIADIETLCVRPLLTSPGRSERYPVVSPDMKWLTYAAYEGPRSRILRRPFAPPAAACADKKPTCTAYCRYAEPKSGAIRREEITKSDLKIKEAWKLLEAACLALNAGELQVPNAQFTACKDTENSQDCAAPEFLPATSSNACGVR